MACRLFMQDLKVLNRRCANQNLVTLTIRCSSSTRDDLTQVTHTGQVFDKTDYRNARFVNAKRYVNENWGIKLIDEIPPKECTERVVYCDGGNGPLGHPKVYINLDKPGAHICGYCGLRFIKKDDHHH